MNEFEQALARPTFLVGAERSGTTLLRLMLDHHPRICFNPEFEYAVSQMGDDDSFPDLATYHHFLATDFIFPGAQFAVDPALSYPELVRSFLRQKLARDGKQVIGATVHHHFDRLLALWPEARFIHLLRDPRDVAKSVIGMGWAGNVWVASERWLHAEQLWSRLAARLPRERYVELRYEDLIRDPQGELTRLCEFMGERFDARMFDYAKTSTYELPDPKLIDQWRKKLSDEEVALVENRVGELLAARGYKPSGRPALVVDAARAAELEAQSRAWCRRFRRQRYGVPLWLAAKISRHLPFQRLRDYFQLRMNAVDLRHIR